MPRIAPATVLGLVGGAGELDAAGLAPAADEHLGLDHDLVARRPARSRSAAARASAGVRATSQAGTGRPWASEQGLGVGFLDLHAGSELRDGLGAEPGDAMVPRRPRSRADTGAIPARRGQRR